MALLTNITTGTTTTLVSKNSSKNVGGISKIVITNVDGHTADNVCVFLEDASANKFHFIKDIDIPVATSLVLEDNLNFPSSKYDLKITTQNASDGGTPSLTVIIK